MTEQSEKEIVRREGGARRERKAESALGPAAIVRSLPRRPRLPVFPLAVLLPCVGSTERLSQYRGQVLERLAAVQNAQNSGAMDEESEQRRRRAVEESMLNQVLQWIAVGAEDRD